MLRTDPADERRVGAVKSGAEMYAVPEEFPTSGDVVRAFNELSLRTRVARLVIARESATNAVVELHKMVERITAMHPDLPGQAEIRGSSDFRWG